MLGLDMTAEQDDIVAREVGAKIKELRKAQTPKLTQSALAAMLDMPQTSLSDVEHGRRQLRLPEEIKLTQVFKTSHDYFQNIARAHLSLTPT